MNTTLETHSRHGCRCANCRGEHLMLAEAMRDEVSAVVRRMLRRRWPPRPRRPRPWAPGLVQYWRRRWPRGGGGNGSPPPGPSPQPDPPPLPSPRPSPPRTVACPPPPELTAAERLAVSVTTNFETGQPFACRVSPTSDPDGISMGMIQWNLRAKTLQSMIRSFEQRGGNLDRHFRALMPSLRELLGMPQSTRPEVDAMIARARQFRQAHPTAWQAALLSLCGDPVFCRLQVENLRSRLAAAHRAVRDLGLGTVRGLTMMFDIQVGDGYAARFNNRMVSGHKIVLFRNRLAARRAALRRELGEREKLIEIADEAASFAGRWQDERRARRLVIANGTGIYRRSNWNLDRLFPGLDRPL